MAIRPSYKLETNSEHGLIEIERPGPGGLTIDLHDALTLVNRDDDSLQLRLFLEEAEELSAILRALLGTATPEELKRLSSSQLAAALE
jgi:hypothetical protein